MKKLSYLLNIVLIGVVGYGAFKFVTGNVVMADDGRTSIVVTADEKEFLMADMRLFLEAVEGITTATGAGDMAAVIDIATERGVAATGNEPAALMAKIPLEMKQLGFGTHDFFDTVAGIARDTNDATQVTVAMGELLGRCTSCHASYRFDIGA